MLSKLLVPPDRSPEAAAALPLACSLAHFPGGELVLVRIASHDQLTEAEAHLADAAAEVQVEGLAVSRVIGRGDAAAGIDDAASAEYADAIVMVTRGRRR